jgi:putative hemolysin
VFVPAERAMIEGVLRLADRPVRAVMTPRAEIVWIDLHADQAALLRAVERQQHSRLLVCAGSLDHTLGVVHTKDLLPSALRGEAPDLAALMQPPLIVPDRTSVLALLDRFRQQKIHMAVLVDEYGSTEGLVTPTDVLEAIAGDLPEQRDEAEPMVVRRDDGSWLLDGMLPIDDFEHLAGLRGLRTGTDFHTMAGFILEQLGRLPKVGESFDFQGARFEVVDLDGRRIDKILYRPRPDDAPVAPG